MTDVRPPSARVAPEILLRLAEPSEVPASALRAQRRAEAAGWSVTPTYCRGYTPESIRSHARLVDSLAIRCQRLHGGHLLRAVAVWLDGRYDMGRILVPWASYGYREWLAEIGSWDVTLGRIERAELARVERADPDAARLPDRTDAAA